VLFLAAGSAAAPGSESVVLAFVPAREGLFVEGAGAPNAIPGEGEVLVVGRFDDVRFAVKNINRVTVVAPDGRKVPLDVGRTFAEFNKIVSVHLCFRVARKEVLPGTEPFELRWGPDVKAENRKVKSIVLDPARREQYREFRWGRRRTDTSADEQVTTLTVIADSYADYYFLWYLVPMALIFVLLTVRKIRARDSADRPAA